MAKSKRVNFAAGVLEGLLGNAVYNGVPNQAIRKHMLQGILSGGQKQLILALNHLTREDIQVIIESLKTNTTLTYLDLRYCQLTDADADLILAMLKANQTLVQLRLDDSEEGLQKYIGDADGQVTGAELEGLKNKISQQKLQAIQAMLAKRQIAESVDIPGSRVKLGMTAHSTKPRVKPQKAKTINPAKRFYATLVIGSLLSLAAIAALVLVGLYVPGAGALMMNIMNFGGNFDVAATFWIIASLMFLPLGSIGLAGLAFLSKKSFPNKAVGEATLALVGVINSILSFGIIITMIIATILTCDFILFSIPTAIAAVAEITAMVLTPVVTIAASVAHYVAVRAVEKAKAVEAQVEPAVGFPQMRKVVGKPSAEQAMGAENGSGNVLNASMVYAEASDKASEDYTPTHS